MIGHHRSPTGLRAGDRVVAGLGERTRFEGGRAWSAMRIETVVDIDADAVRRGGNAVMTLAHGDETRRVIAGHTGVHDDQIESTGWRTIWIDPLPAGDAVALTLVRTIAGTPRGGSCVLLWIADIMPDGRAYAHQITDIGETEGVNLVGTDGCLYDQQPIAIRADEPFARRALVVAHLGRAQDEDGVVVHRLVAARTLLADIALPAAAAAIPAAIHPADHFHHGNLAGRHAVLEEAERAWTETQPSEAVVLAWNDGGTAWTRCLATSGIAFWHNDDPGAYAEQSVPGPGLWMWTEVSMRVYTDHEGVADCDMEGEWRPATMADVERLLGPVPCADRDIADHACEDEAEGQTARYIAFAQASAREDAATGEAELAIA